MIIYGLYIRTPDIWSPIIRAATWSPWSHVATVLDVNTAYEALFKSGVVKTTVPTILLRASKFEFVEYECDPKIVKFLEAQLGKPYDLTAVLGIGFHRDWEDEDKWFCSEHFGAACKYANCNLVDKKLSRLTPLDVYASVKGKKLGVGYYPL